MNHLERKRTLSILALIFGLSSLLTFAFAIKVTGSFYLMYVSLSAAVAFAVVALVLSILSRTKHQKNGLATGGTVCGIVVLLLCVLLLLLIVLTTFGASPSAV